MTCRYYRSLAGQRALVRNWNRSILAAIGRPCSATSSTGGTMKTKQANRRKFLKTTAAAAGWATVGIATGKAQTAPMSASIAAKTPATPPANKPTSADEIAYGTRSAYVKSIRTPVAQRPSPDAFGLTFHVSTPLADNMGIITPS